MNEGLKAIGRVGSGAAKVDGLYGFLILANGADVTISSMQAVRQRMAWTGPIFSTCEMRVLNDSLPHASHAAPASAAQAEPSYRHIAAQLLCEASTLLPLTQAEALELVHYMHPYSIPAGEWFIVEDDNSHNDFMMLILSGEVVVESRIAEGHTLTITVLKAGQWVGELGMLDGNPRQAACRAADDSDVVCGILSRQEFLGMIDKHPKLAAKLSLILASNVARYLRDMHQKMCRYAEIQNAIRTTL